jgi:hypothetical protein
LDSKRFQSWWNEHYFHTDHPDEPAYKRLYGIYKQLHSLEADLDYIEHLNGLLIEADFLSKLMAYEDEADNQEGGALGHPSKLSKRVKQEVSDAVEKFALDLDDSSRKRLEEKVMKAAKARLAEKLNKQKGDYARKVISEFGTNPIKRVLLECFSADIFYETGRRTDDIGSFFLLAVSQHIRESTKKPRYLLASRLLCVWRDNEKSSVARAARLNAMVRVDKLKKAHPSFGEQLQALKTSYLNFKTSETQSPADSSANWIIGRNFRRSLLEQLSATFEANPSQLATLYNSIVKKHYPDAQEITLKELAKRLLSLKDK